MHRGGAVPAGYCRQCGGVCYLHDRAAEERGGDHAPSSGRRRLPVSGHVLRYWELVPDYALHRWELFMLHHDAVGLKNDMLKSLTLVANRYIAFFWEQLLANLLSLSAKLAPNNCFKNPCPWKVMSCLRSSPAALFPIVIWEHMANPVCNTIDDLRKICLRIKKEQCFGCNRIFLLWNIGWVAIGVIWCSQAKKNF